VCGQQTALIVVGLPTLIGRDEREVGTRRSKGSRQKIPICR